MKAYLKGFYGYKNFGDELLLFGVISWIFSNYSVEKLVIESGDKVWLKNWLEQNKSIIDINLSKVEVIPIVQHKHKILTHILSFIGFNKYKKYFKFFGGGEVLNTERKFPRNGRNINLLHRYAVRKSRFVLLGGIGKVDSPNIKKLYHKLLPKASKIVVREKSSYDIVKDFLKEYKGVDIDSKLELYQDFSLEVLNKYKKIYLDTQSDQKQETEVFSMLENIKEGLADNAQKLANFLKSKKSNSEDTSLDYVLININSHVANNKYMKQIQDFCEKHKQSKKIYFPCDMSDDSSFFDSMKKNIPDLQFYDWTKYPLKESLDLLSNAKSAIGARLHFLYPLKVFGVPFESIIYKDKVRKLILEDK